MRLAKASVACLLMAGLILTTGCAGNRAPAAIAGDVAHNGQVVVEAVDKIQKFIASEEAAGRLPAAQAQVAMSAIGRGLEAAQKAGGYLDQLVKLNSVSATSDNLIKQIQDALALASTESASALIPIQNEAIKKQVLTLVSGVNQAIGQINNLILTRGGQSK